MKIPVAVKDGVIELSIDYKARPCKCKNCGAEIFFAETAKGKRMPICKKVDNFDNSFIWISHFANCPGADSFRK